MNILFIGDIVGEPGRFIIRDLLAILRNKYELDFIVANAENSAGGTGVTPKVADELFAYGIDCLTTGDHIWKKREIIPYLEKNRNILRPANFPDSVSGIGATIIEKEKFKLGVINLQGRVFFSNFHLECPFRIAEKEIEKLKSITPIIIIDFHAEATSEKVALAWYLDGRISALLGTHTHIQTADEIVLPQHTAYITDVGMTGPYDSVIGRNKEEVIKKFLTQVSTHLEVAKNNTKLCGVIITLDPLSGQAEKIERIQYGYGI